MDKPTPVHNSFRIRFAQEADIPAILGFIHALADYEHMSDQVIADDALLREWKSSQHLKRRCTALAV